MAKLKDRVGIRYGRLLVLSLDSIRRSKSGHTAAFWKCKCDCGNIVVCAGASLESGRTKSCGCYRKASIHDRLYRGGNRKLYGVWRMMHKRCEDTGYKHYPNYGGRGISVCDEWSGNDGYTNFQLWAKRNGYSDGLTLDRINNDGNYEPSNCSFATMKTQSNNKRNNVRIEIDGITHTLTEWCEIYRVPFSRVRARYMKLGWDIKSALTTPPLKLRRKQEWQMN